MRFEFKLSDSSQANCFWTFGQRSEKTLGAKSIASPRKRLTVVLSRQRLLVVSAVSSLACLQSNGELCAKGKRAIFVSEAVKHPDWTIAILFSSSLVDA